MNSKPVNDSAEWKIASEKLEFSDRPGLHIGRCQVVTSESDKKATIDGRRVLGGRLAYGPDLYKGFCFNNSKASTVIGRV